MTRHVNGFERLPETGADVFEAISVKRYQRRSRKTIAFPRTASKAGRPTVPSLTRFFTCFDPVVSGAWARAAKSFTSPVHSAAGVRGDQRGFGGS